MILVDELPRKSVRRGEQWTKEGDLGKYSSRNSLMRRIRASHLASCLAHVGQTIRPVDSVGVVVIQVVNAVLQLSASMALVNAEDKEADVGIQ